MSVLSRRLAATIGAAAVAASVLLVTPPATAGTAEDAAWLQGVGIPATGSRWSTFTVADFAQLARSSCFSGDDAPWAEPDIDDITYVRTTPSVEAVIISAEVFGDPVPDGAVCTFAVTGTPYAYGNDLFASALSGSYALAVASPVDPVQSSTGALDGSTYTTSKPLFTDVAQYASATLHASGSHATSVEQVTTVPGGPKTAQEVSYAKKVRDRTIKNAKTSYRKAIRRAERQHPAKARSAAKSRAKTVYRRSVKAATIQYRRATAASPTVTTRRVQDVVTPFSLKLDL